MNMNNNHTSELSLSDAYRDAVRISSDGTESGTAIELLTALQNRISSASLFSSNDVLDDLPTSSMPLLSVEFHLATALSSAPTQTSAERQVNINRSRDLLYGYLRKLDDLEGVLDDEPARYYKQMLEDEEEDDGEGNYGKTTRMTPTQIRETKIARYRARKVQREEFERLTALRERRSRLGVADEDEVDGYDGDGVDRSLALAELRGYAFDALDELLSTRKELDMLEMAVRMENERGEMQRHKGETYGGGGGGGGDGSGQLTRNSLEVTHVTRDSATGQIQLKREEIQSSVFRPGWNLPTMTLTEYGETEMSRAREREERQKQTEFEGLKKPRRYEQLVKDGAEDNADLVDASARLDREWDDWKDANPKGSGNKMADVGDRNF